MGKKEQSFDGEEDKVSFGCSLSPRRMSKRFSAVSYDCEGRCDVREGYLAVYVGSERKRFVIRTRYLSLPVFRTLLDKAEEEFGFLHKGGLTLPCDVAFFKKILQVLETNGAAVEKQMTLTDVLDFIAKERESETDALQHSRKLIGPFFGASLEKSFG